MEKELNLNFLLASIKKCQPKVKKRTKNLMVGFYCPDSQLNPTREGMRPIFLCRRGGQLKSNLNFGFPAVFRFTRPGRRYGQPPPRIFLV